MNTEIRQIGFRGKSAEGEWHYGLLAQSAGISGQPDEGMYISNSIGAPYAYKIIPSSIGEFIGLSDKIKTKIYEGDRVEVDITGINYNTGKTTGVVKSIDGCFTVEFDIPTYDIVLKCKRPRLYVKCFTVNHAIKVIGNIHDNPENGDKIICATE